MTIVLDSRAYTQKVQLSPWRALSDYRFIFLSTFLLAIVHTCEMLKLNSFSRSFDKKSGYYKLIASGLKTIGFSLY